MRFGAFVPQGWRLDLVGIDPVDHWDTMLGVARTIERTGFESLWVFDHFHTTPVATQEVTYEAWTLMSAFAAATETVRLGQMCTCNSYRLPSYLAKVAASVDVISGGRLEMGIGGGWYKEEYLAYGYDFPTASVRLGELDEAVQIMRMMWTEDEATIHGEHYSVDGAICRPKPVQDPHIPLWIAGGGEQMTLRTAAKYASYTNFGDDLAEFVHKSDVLRSHTEEVGTRFEAIVRSSDFVAVCAATEDEARERVEWLDDKLTGVIPDDRRRRVIDDIAGGAGTPEQWIERLLPWQDAGLGYAIFFFVDCAYDTSGLELFARDVIPALA